MLRRTLRRPRAILLVLAVAVVAAGCQPQVSLQSPRTSAALPPGSGDVETPLVADEQGHPIIPDAVHGQQVFGQNCAVCHGMDGKGNGPMAKTLIAPQHDVLAALVGLVGITLNRPSLPSAPADFTNRDLESVITPAIMYQTVTDGRAYTAMPSFGPEASFGANQAQALSNTDRWDANVYEMMFRTSPAELSAAKELYGAQCAVCHGMNGDGKGPQGPQMAAQVWTWSQGYGPGIFTDINYMVQQNGADLANVIRSGAGPMPAFSKLTPAQVNGLVDYVYTFFYKHPTIK